MEGSEFVNEDSKVNLVQGLNGKGGSWIFEELIDLGVHAKSKPLMDDGGPEGPRVAFEEKTSSIHPAQPIETMSGKGFYSKSSEWCLYCFDLMFLLFSQRCECAGLFKACWLLHSVSHVQLSLRVSALRLVWTARERAQCRTASADNRRIRQEKIKTS